MSGLPSWTLLGTVLFSNSELLSPSEWGWTKSAVRCMAASMDRLT